MAGFPQHYGDQFQGNSSPAAGASRQRDATAVPAPRHAQSAPSSYYRPPPDQPRDYADVPRGAVLPSVNATGNYQLNEGGENMPRPVENIAAQAQLQDPRYVDMGHYDDHPPPQGHRDNIVGDDAGIVQDVPAQAHIIPPPPEIDAINFEFLEAGAGPAPAFLDELPHRPVRNGRSTEVLRQLAILYLHDPNSQVTWIGMEPGQADGVMVVIALRLTNL